MVTEVIECNPTATLCFAALPFFGAFCSVGKERTTCFCEVLLSVEETANERDFMLVRAYKYSALCKNQAYDWF